MTFRPLGLHELRLPHIYGVRNNATPVSQCGSVVGENPLVWIMAKLLTRDKARPELRQAAGSGRETSFDV